MRAKLALTLAAISLVAALAPATASVTYKVEKVLLHGSTLLPQDTISRNFGGVRLTERAVIEGANACAAPVAVNEKVIVRHDLEPNYTKMPVALGTTKCGAAILTQYPSDLDIRRERLQRDMDLALANNALSQCDYADMKNALNLIASTELQYRQCDRELSTVQARTLYKALDKVGDEYNYATKDNNWKYIGDRGPTWWY